MSATDTLSHCAAEVRRADRDRFVTALFAPQDRREGLMALYALNLELARIRDHVNEPMLGVMRLQWWRDLLTGMCAGKAAPQGHPVAEALAPAIHRHDLPVATFVAMLEARQSDFDEDPFADMEALSRYLDGTAGNLARLSARLLGIESDQGGEAAVQAAMAQAYCGLVRALAVHQARGWAAVPRERRTQLGLEASRLLHAHNRPKLDAVIADFLAAAQARHDNARHLARGLTGADRVAVRPLVLSLPQTRGYLKRLRAAGFDPTDGRHIAARPQVLAVLMAHLLRRC